MKKIFTGLFILSSIIFFGCKSESNDPKDVLVSFFEALSSKDIKKARTLATAESKSMLDLMEEGMKNDSSSGSNAKFNKENLEFGDVKIEGDKAIVPVKEKGSGSTVNYILKNEKGWKVAFDKATMMQMGSDNENINDNFEKEMNEGKEHSSDISIDSLKNDINEKLRGLDTITAKDE